ncbi:MAG: carboxypeptidase regulatory-like domain-containing protein [Chloracidobacterium sp.]|nr:carboxypeptidase regulatory-like domain-containing protein [Chloracidobacterium sp.]
MLSFTRRHLVIAIVFSCCAVFALANFSSIGKAYVDSAIVVPKTAARVGGISVSLPHVNAMPGIVLIPITVGDTTGQGIISYDLNIDFNPAIVQPASPAFEQAGTLSSAMSITPNSNNPGHLIVSAFQAANLTGAGTLLILRFNVIGGAGQSTALTFADYTDPGGIFHPGFVFNEGDPTVSLTNGSVAIPSDPTPTSTVTHTPTNTNTPTNTPTPPQYQIFDIGVVQSGDGASQGMGVSPGGLAVGRSVRTGGAQAFTYIGGAGIAGLPNLAARPFCVSNSAADTGIGHIVGTCSTTLFGTSRLPTIWQGGAVSQLPLPSGETLGDAYDMNSSIIAVGSVGSGSFQRGVIYNGATATVISQTTSNGSFFTTAFGINDSNRIAGIGIDPNNAARNVPMVYDIGAGSAIDIGALSGFNGGIAFGIGNGGHVVGSSMLNQGSGLPFIWTQAGGMVAIPLPDGTTQGSARGVNTAGWAVGTASSAFAIPFLYTGSATFRLADLIPSGTGWDLSTNTSSSAMGISDNNIIVGTGVLNGAVHAYAMVPAFQSTPTSTATATGTVINTATATATGTVSFETTTPTPTNTSTATSTLTNTPTANPTMTISQTGTPTPTATNTPRPTDFGTMTPTFTSTATPSATPVITFSSATYIEDESQIAIISITRTGNLSGTNVVAFSTADGTATGGASCSTGVDYISGNGQPVTFFPNDQTVIVVVTICGDSITEPDQTINLLLSGANLGSPSTAVLMINDTASTFRSTTPVVFNQGQPAAPYPSNLTVTGGPTQIGSMRVTLYDFTTTSVSVRNTHFLLVSPSGQHFVLMANTGGTATNGLATVNFTDTAGQIVPNNAFLVTGDYEPTSLGTVPIFPSPAPSPPYNLPGGTVGGTGTQTLLGNFGGTNSNGVWSLYIRDSGNVFVPSGSAGEIFGGWGLEFLPSTAAGASISGRVLTADGFGIRNAKVVISGNSLSEPLVVTTGSFGYFTFDGLAVGETYVVTVNSQRYRFSTPSRVISLIDNVTEADFVADPLE